MKTRHLFLIISFFVALLMACSPDPLPEDPDSGQTEQPSDSVQTPSDTTQTEPSDTTQTPDPDKDKENEEGSGKEDGTEDEGNADENTPTDPVPAVAPVFTIEMEDGWAAVATLTTDRQDGTEYWISGSKDGDPLGGFNPVNISTMEKGSKVKLYPYFSSEHIASTGVQSGETLYLVSQIKTETEIFKSSVEFTCQADPLEVVIYDDAPAKGVNLSGSITKTSDYSVSYADDKAAGEYCIKADATPEWAELYFSLWDSSAQDYWDLREQSKAFYNIEFYFKADSDIKGNVGLTTQIVKEGGYYTATSQTAWQDFTSAPKGTPIPANTWTKISIPLNQIWFNGANALPDGYQGYNDDGTTNKWLSNYYKFGRFYVSQHYVEGQPKVWYIDHIVIRKSTL